MPGWFGTPSSGGSGGYSFAAPPVSTLSPTQAAEIKTLQSKTPAKTLLGDIESAGGGILHGASSGLGAALNYLGRPAEAYSTGLVDLLKSKQSGGDLGAQLGALLHGASAGIQDKGHMTFSDVLRQAYPGFTSHHKTATAIGGLLGGVLTDPTLPLIAGAQAIPGVNVGVDEAMAAKLADMLGTAATSSERAAQAQSTLDAIGKLGPDIVDKNFSARKALAQLELQSATRDAAGKVPTTFDLAIQSTTEAAAKVEAEQGLQKVLQLKYSLPFTGGKSIPLTPTTIAGLRVAPKIPSLKGAAEAGIPGLSKTADALGKMFKHGWGVEDYAKPALAATVHAKELFHSNLFHRADALMGQHFKTLSRQEMLKAINYGETRDGIVRGSKLGRTLNVAMLAKSVRHGELSAGQGAFLKDWHTTMEEMRQQEVQAGISHAGSIGNHVYVPHRVLREGGVVTKVPIKEGKAFGLAKERQNLTLQNLASAYAAGRGAEKGLTLVTDPAEILARRVQESADAQSQMVLNRVLAHTSGVPSLIPDVARRAAALQAVRRAMAKQRTLDHVVNQRGTRISIGRKTQLATRAALNKVFDRHQPALDSIDKQVAEHQAALETAGPRAPSFSAARGMSQEAFRKSTAHFSKADRLTAIALHARLKEGKSLEAQLARFGKTKGGPQAVKGLASKVLAHASAVGVDTHLAPAARGESWRGNIANALSTSRGVMKRDYNELVKKYQTGSAFDHGKAIKRLEAQRERVYARAAKQIDRAKVRIAAQRVKMDEEWQRTFDRQARQHANLQKQIEKEQRAYGAMKNNPHIPDGWLQLDKNLGDGKYHFDPEIHAAITNQEKAMANPGIMQSIDNAARSLISIWKVGATSVNPGYRVRNTSSDIWNMYIAGVPTPRIVQFGRKAAVMQRVAFTAGQKLAKGDTNLSNKEVLALRAITEMHLHGILSGLFQGDVEKASKAFSQGRRARDFLNGADPRGLGKAYVQMALDVNRHVENWGRITHYLYRREYQHLSAQASADWVKKAHFDYQELTPFEQNRMKLVFPFYTWTRKDIPYQLSQIASRPGKYAAFGQAVQSSNELATGNPRTPDAQPALFPSWMRQNYMFRVPGGGYINPNIGVQDLADLEHPLSQGIVSHLNPVAGLAVGLMTGKNSTGQDIVGTHPRNPVTGLVGHILGAIPGNPADVGPTMRQINGKEVSGLGASPWVQYAASQLPLGTLLTSSLSSINRDRRGTGKILGGYLGGVSVYNRDLTAEQTAAQLNFQDEMKRVIKGLRDTKKIPQASPKKQSAFAQSLNSLITQKGG